MNKHTLLIADDHKMVRKGFCQILKSIDCVGEIFEADNGQEAIDMLTRHPVDLVILDVNMPILNGIETVKKIRKKNQEIKIIILTMHLDDNLIMEALEEGVNGYLFKNSDIDELTDSVCTVLENGEYFSNEVKEKVMKYHSQKKKITFMKLDKEKIPISKREIEIIKLIADGYKSHQIAEMLFISESTVVKHRKNIIRKLNLKNTAEVVKFAIHNNLI